MKKKTQDTSIEEAQVAPAEGAQPAPAEEVENSAKAPCPAPEVSPAPSQSSAETPHTTNPPQMTQAPQGKGQSSLLKKTGYFLTLNAGVLLLAISMFLFNAPNNFALGGMGGLSILLAKYITPQISWLTQPVILAILNGILLIVGLIFLGKSMTLKTIYCTIAYSLEVYLLDLIPLQRPMTQQPLLELVYAIIISGAAHAIVFNCRASTGGSDIIALIVKKFAKINIGAALLAADFLIAGLSFWTFGPEIGLYSVLGVFAKSFVIDGIIENIAKTKYVTIITSNPDKVSEVILDYIHRGYTKFNAEGGYTGEPRTVVITVCRRSQAVRLKARLHEVDPTSFVIITDANEILGKGFAERI